MLSLRHHSTPSCVLITVNRTVNPIERLSIDAIIPRSCFRWIPAGLTLICSIWFSAKSNLCDHFLVPTMDPVPVIRRIPFGCKSTNALDLLGSQDPGEIFHLWMTYLQSRVTVFVVEQPFCIHRVAQCQGATV